VTDEPIRDDELAALFAPLSRFGRIGLAVSGGADSTALMHLATRWLALLEAAAPACVVLTVDHGLRAEAAAEARAVAEQANALGLPHETLHWVGEKPRANVQALARNARLELLTEAARRHDLSALVMAHHLDDQAETFLLRLARGSGVAGLAAMADERMLDGITLLRPLLGVSRARLRATLLDAGVGWSEDPSNTDAGYARVRMRGLMPALAGEGLTAERLAGTARHMRRAADALDALVDGFLADSALVHPGGFVGLRPGALAAAREEIALRLLARAIRFAGGQRYTPRLDALEGLFDSLTDTAAQRVCRTLGGAVVERACGAVWIYREAGRDGFEECDLSGAEPVIWDRRFRVSLQEPVVNERLTLRALGLDGRCQLDAETGGEWPKRAVETVPSLWIGENVVAAAGVPVASIGGRDAPVARFEPIAPLAGAGGAGEARAGLG